MKTRLLYLFAAAIFISLYANPGMAESAGTNPPPRLTVELRDGSRAIGTSVEHRLKFHSALFGDFKLEGKDIRSIDCVTTNSARLTAANGDVLMVSFAASDFALATSFGPVTISAASVRRLSVAAGATTGAHPAGLVALWSGEGEGKDSVGNNDATLTDITFAEGRAGRAFAFNGFSSSMKVPASPALDLGAGDGFTLVAWIKPADVNGLHPLLQWSDDNMLNLWIGIRPYENGVLRGDITDEEGNHFLVSHPDTLTPGVFQHIAFAYDKTSGEGTLYLNGVVVARRQLGRQLIAHTKGDLWFSQRDERPGNWSTDRAYAGLMDEIALYNRALSAAEIQTLCPQESQGEPLASPAPSAGWFESWMR
jgi:hypothetical protein